MAYQSFEKLEVWKRACRLAVRICNEISNAKHRALCDQMYRSSVSIPSNIAEGTERDSKSDTIRFLRIAKGSSAELRTQLYIVQKLNLLSPTIAGELISESKEISAMRQGLIFSIKRTVRNNNSSESDSEN